MSWLLRAEAWAFVAVLPGTERLPGLEEAKSRLFLERLDREASFVVRFTLAACTLLFLLTPPLTIRRFRPAFWLSPEQLDRHALAAANHRFYWLRQCALMIKTFACLCWGADPQVRRALGMEPYGPDPGTWRTA